MADGYLTELEFRDYVRLFQMAADRVLAMHPQMREEVNRMTEPLIKLPSMIENELRAKLRAEIAEQKTEIAEQRTEIAKQRTEIAKQKAEIEEKDAEIRRLQELVNQFTTGKPAS